jgi:hypothetical protein
MIHKNMDTVASSVRIFFKQFRDLKVKTAPSQRIPISENWDESNFCS